MAVLVSDSFTDTNGTTLASHTAEIGGSPVKVTNSPATAQIATNRARSASTTNVHSYYSYTAVTTPTEHDVEIIVACVTNLSGGNGVAAAARQDVAVETEYIVLDNGTDTFLIKHVNGVSTQLGSTFTAGALTAGQTRRLRCQAQDAAKKGFVDGVERFSSADNAITAAGKPGIWFYGDATDSTGLHIDSVVATDLIPVPVPVLRRPSRGLVMR